VTTARLSQLQQRILAWLLAEAQRTRGTMAADHRDLARALGHDKSNLSHSLRNLAAKGLVRVHRTPGGQAEAVELTAEGRNRVAALTSSCE
jgi:DNA-binding MarR family transcriptional regulator